MSHTQGPWKIITINQNLRTESNHIVTEDFKFVATTSPGERLSPETWETDRANANLISAAPDLLAVAELILKEWEAPTEGVLPGTLIARLSQYSDVARAAIQKAKG